MDLLVTLLVLHALGSLGFCVLTTAMWVLLRGERPGLDRRRLGWFAREWAAVTVIIPLRALGLWQVQPRPTGPSPSGSSGSRAAAEAAPPVLLVPGFAMNRTCFAFLAFFLRRRGWQWVWAINNGPFSSPIPVQAASLARRIQELKAASGAEQVDVVAHSMGGLITTWYLQELGGAPHVRRLVTLGTPWHGSRLAAFGLRRESRDLLPGSEVVRRIEAPRVPTTSLWSPDDTIVLPSENAHRPELPGRCIPLVGHLSMLMSAQVYREVAQLLLAGSPLLAAAPASEGQTAPADGDRERIASLQPA